MMNKTLSLELILSEEVQRLFDHFASLLKLRVVFFSLDSSILRSDKNAKNSDYCNLVQKKLFSMERCFKLDSEKRAECLKNGATVCYCCHAGLREAIAPVMIDKVVAGFIMIGQFRTTKELPAKIRKRCKNSALLPQLEKTFVELPYISPKRLTDILGMFMMLADYIVAREMVTLRGDWMLDRINHYLSLNLKGSATLTGLAQFIGRSKSTISHLLKIKYGKSFKQMLIEKRLAIADEMLRSRPELNIGEIADMAGFDDRFYFSRIYRKYRGTTPGKFRLTR